MNNKKIDRWNYIELKGFLQERKQLSVKKQPAELEEMCQLFI
jgi:hypothetical protein